MKHRLLWHVVLGAAVFLGAVAWAIVFRLN